MNIHELAKRTKVAERQIRFMISEGCVPAPRGGRSNADYGDDHLEAVTRFQRLRKAGFPPASIKLLLETEAGVPFEAAPGVTLVVSPHLIASGQDPAPLLAALSETFQAVLNGDKANDKDD